MFKFELFLEKKPLREYFFDNKPSITVGRHPRHDIHIDFIGVSGTHARIHFLPELLLEDLGSKNGTLLNGERIAHAAPLKHRDIIGITRYELRFSDGQAAKEADEEDCAGHEMVTTLLIPPHGEGGEDDTDATVNFPPGGNLEMSTREFECLYWLSRGKTTAEISALLKISERAVNFHVTNICGKLGTANRAQAVAKAIALKLLDP
jgi:DNA-binding CsgD family transcriptional regulator